MDIRPIQAKLRTGNYRFSDIDRHEVEEAILAGEIIEAYPEPVMNRSPKNGLMGKYGGNQAMKCVFCGGILQKAAVTFIYEEEETYLFVEHVPAEVCPQCGEKLYTPEVTEALLQFAKQQAEPIKIIHVPVDDFAEKVVGM